MKLSDKAIKALKPKSMKYYIHGDMSNGKHGFALCVYPPSVKQPAGSKSWFFIYRFEGKKCFLPLGKYPAMSLADAAKEFDKHWQIFASGKNPATVEQERQEEREAAPTFKELANDYLKRHAQVNKKSWLEDQRILEKEIFPAWGKRKAEDITKKHVNSLLEKIVDRGSSPDCKQHF